MRCSLLLTAEADGQSKNDFEKIMLKQKISIVINSDYDRDKIFDEFQGLMYNWVRNRQIIGKPEMPFLSYNELIGFQTTLEIDTLSDKYNDDYARVIINNLEEWCNSKLMMSVAGEVYPLPKGVCGCETPGFYILFTHAFNDEGVVTCGTCNHVVPFYKLKLENDAKYEMFNWETNYKACDHLQLGCSVGEKWATKQMSDPKSELSKQGLKICQSVTKHLDVPMYYYLHNYRHIAHQKDKSRKCPQCDSEWLLEESLHEFYNFKCDKCRLISSFSPVTN